MPKLLTIKPSVGTNFLNFDLRDLVALIPLEGKQLAWCVSPMGEGLEITGDLSPLGTDALAFMKQVNTSVNGVPVSWTDLVHLSDALHQTIWGAFIGCRSATTFAALPAEFHGWWRYLDRIDSRFYQLVEIAFQAVDSSYWLVYTWDDAIGERIAAAFSNVQIAAAEI